METYVKRKYECPQEAHCGPAAMRISAVGASRSMIPITLPTDLTLITIIQATRVAVLNSLQPTLINNVYENDKLKRVATAA